MAQVFIVVAQIPMVAQVPTVAVLQVLHINLMMKDTRLYMMMTTMIGTDIIAIQTMPTV